MWSGTRSARRPAAQRRGGRGGGDRLPAGARGAAAQDIGHPATGAFQSLVGAQAVLPLAASFGFARPAAGAAVHAAVAAAAAGHERASEFLDELAGRVATGVAWISVVLDPGLVVLGGELGRAGGTALAGRVAAEVGRICPARPQVVPTTVDGGPVLRGAVLAAVDQARSELLASVARSVKDRGFTDPPVAGRRAAGVLPAGAAVRIVRRPR